MYHITFYFQAGFTLVIEKYVLNLMPQMLRQLPFPPLPYSPGRLQRKILKSDDHWNTGQGNLSNSHMLKA